MKFNPNECEFEFSATKRVRGGHLKTKVKALSEESIRLLHTEYFNGNWNVGVAYNAYGKPVLKSKSHDKLAIAS